MSNHFYPVCTTRVPLSKATTGWGVWLPLKAQILQKHVLFSLVKKASTKDCIYYMCWSNSTVTSSEFILISAPQWPREVKGQSSMISWDNLSANLSNTFTSNMFWSKMLSLGQFQGKRVTLMPIPLLLKYSMLHWLNPDIRDWKFLLLARCFSYNLIAAKQLKVQCHFLRVVG